MLERFDFGKALAVLKEGLNVCREGWNGKDMYIRLATGRELCLGHQDDPRSCGGHFLPFIVMSTVTGDLVPWLASQTDVLAEDWQVAP